MRTADFLDIIHPRLGEALIESRAFRAREVRRDYASSAAQVLAFLAKVRQSFDVFFGVASRSRRGGTKSDLACSGALWADIDRPDARQCLQASGLPTPSLIVSSGTLGHLQAYWLLSEPFELRDPDPVAIFESYLRGIVQASSADPACVDATRILRLPGSRNYKHAKPKFVEVVDYSPARYHIEAFPQGEVVGAAEFEFEDAVAPMREVQTDWAVDILENGYANQRNPNKSAVDFKLVVRLLDEGFEPEEVLWLVQQSSAIGQRKREGYWRLTVENAPRRREV